MSRDNSEAITRWEAWVASRTPGVQALIQEFPLRTRWYVLGWTEDGNVLLSRIDPQRSHAAAVAAHVEVPATLLRLPREVGH